jgi:hypothetical protein
MYPRVPLCLAAEKIAKEKLCLSSAQAQIYIREVDSQK